MHELLVAPCALTDIAIILPPSPEPTTAAAHVVSKSERWLIWIDRGRGLLGRTAFVRSRPKDPPAGRRLPPYVLDPCTQKSPSPPKVQGTSSTSPHEVAEGGEAKRGSTSKKIPVASLPVTENAVQESRLVLDSGSELSCEVFEAREARTRVVKSPATSKGTGGNINDNGGYTQPENHRTGHKLANDPSTSTRDMPHAPPYSPKKETVTQILLRNIDRPSRVAVAPGDKTLGVFILHTGSSDSLTPSGKPKEEREDRLKSTHDPCGSTQTTGGSLSFLPWEAQESVTLVEHLYEPIALYVTENHDVFILERVRQGPSEILQQGREHDGGRQSSYRVCHMDGSGLSRFLDSNDGHDKVGHDGDNGAKGHLCDDDDDFRSFQCGSGALIGADGSGAHGGVVPSIPHTPRHGTRETQRPSKLAWQSRVLAPAGSIVLPSPEKGHPPELPVDMCVLPEGTIVIAFRRFAPLNDAPTAAEAQGVVRAFPPSTQHLERQHSIITERDKATRRRGSDLSYQPDNGYVVAEGLPVITGIATNCRGAVYVSLCGSQRSGALIAIASLGNPRDVALKSSPPGEDFGGGRWGEKEVMNKQSSRRGRWCLDGGGGCRSGTEAFLPIMSGFASALSVDEDSNLFFVTAQNISACGALWSRPPGASLRRVSSICESLPVCCLKASVDAEGGAGADASSASPAYGRSEPCASGVEEHGDHSGKEVNQREERDRKTRSALPRARGRSSKVTPGTPGISSSALSEALIQDDELIPSKFKTMRSLFGITEDDTETPAAAAMTCRTRDSGGSDLDGGPEVRGVKIAVVARCRPLLKREKHQGARTAIKCQGDEVIVLGEELPLKRSRRFRFDRVLGPSTSQARVYAETVAPVVCKMLDGYNCSVLAYGQTGSGKTFTMEGGLRSSAGRERFQRGLRSSSSATAVGAPRTTSSSAEPSALSVETLGIIPRVVHTIFRDGDAGGNRRYCVYISHMEIYNERLFDLLVLDESNAQEATPTSRSARRGQSPESGSTHPWSSPRGASPTAGLRTTPKQQQHQSPRGRLVFGVHPGSGRREGSVYSAERQGPDKTTTRRVEGLFSREEFEGPAMNKKQQGSSIRSIGRIGSSRLRGSEAQKSRGKGLTIEENPELGVIVKGLTQIEVNSAEEIFAILARSSSNRRTAETLCNLESSRSHSVFCVRVISAEPTPWGGEVSRDGRLSLVDLSGSENIERSGAVGVRAAEAAAIGQSLLALGRVIKALVQRARHIPYRESKLTRILADSLGGNAFSAIILNVTPNHSMLDETLSTLAYAKTARSIKNVPKQRILSKTTPGDGNGEASVGTDAKNDAERDLQVESVGETARRAPSPSPTSSSSTSRSFVRARWTHVRPWEAKVPIRQPEDQCTNQRWERLCSSVVSRANHSIGTLAASRAHDQTSACRDPRSATAGPISARQAAELANRPTNTTRGFSSSRAAIGKQRKSRAEHVGHIGHDWDDGDYERSDVQKLQSRASHRARSGARGPCRAAKNLRRDEHTGSHQPSANCGRDPSPNEAYGVHDDDSAERIFDNAAARWVYSTVLMDHSTARDTGPRSGSNPGTLEDEADGAPAPRHDPSERSIVPALELTPNAEAACTEIFRRYDHVGQDFLLAEEVADLTKIWTCEQARPLPERVASPREERLLQDGRPEKSRRHRAGRTESPQRPECGDIETSMVLALPAFLRFCRDAATRDALFVRHLLVTCGYDLNLAPIEPPVRTSPTVNGDPAHIHHRHGGRTSDREAENRSTSKHPMGRITRNSMRTSNPMSNTIPVRQPKSVGSTHRREAIGNDGDDGEDDGDEDTQWQSSNGGIVNVAELWDWMEDIRSDAEKYKIGGGVLSRGGGARFSKLPPPASSAGAHRRESRSFKAVGQRENIDDGNADGTSLPLTKSPPSGVPLPVPKIAVGFAETEEVEESRPPPFGADACNDHERSGARPGASQNNAAGMAEHDLAREKVSHRQQAPRPTTNTPAHRQAHLASSQPPFCEWCGCAQASRSSLHTPTFCDRDT